MIIVNLFKLICALFLALYLRQLIRSFHFMGISELRRRVSLGHQKAERVLSAKMYGLKLWFVLWSTFSLMIIIVVLTLYNLSSFWVTAAAGIGILSSLLFVSRIGWPKASLDLAAQAAPHLVRFLAVIQIAAKILRPIGLSKTITADSPTPIHSKEHLIEMMNDLKAKTKSRQVVADLDLAISALTFGSKKTKTLMVPIDKMRTVRASQNLTLKLISKLHDSGFSVFPVQRSQEDFCGVLRLKDVEKLSKTNSIVHQVMRPEICYIHAEAPLSQVLDAFLKTQQQLFLVTDQSCKVLGLITLDDVLRRYLGDYQFDDFKYYDDLELVAERFALSKTSKKAAKSRSKTIKEKENPCTPIRLRGLPVTEREDESSYSRPARVFCPQ